MRRGQILISFKFCSHSYQLVLDQGTTFFEARAAISNKIDLDRKEIIIFDSKGKPLMGDVKSMTFEEDQNFIVKNKKMILDNPDNHQVKIYYKYNGKTNYFLLSASKLSSNNIKYYISKIESISKQFIKLFDDNQKELPQFPAEEDLEDLEAILVVNTLINKKNHTNEETSKNECQSSPDEDDKNLQSDPSDNQKKLDSNHLIFHVQFNNVQKSIEIDLESLVSDLEKKSRIAFQITGEFNSYLTDKENKIIIKSDFPLNKLPKGIILLLRVVNKNENHISIKIETPDKKVLQFKANETSKIIDVKKAISSKINYSINEFELYCPKDKIIDNDVLLKEFNNVCLKLKCLKPKTSSLKPAVNGNIKSGISHPVIPSKSSLDKMPSKLPIKKPLQKEEAKVLHGLSPHVVKNFQENPLKLVGIASNQSKPQTKDLKERKLKELKEKIMKIQTKLENTFRCSICYSIFEDPVLTSDGLTYDRNCIKNWLAGHGTSPMTGKELQNKVITTNQIVKGMIIELKENLKKFQAELSSLTS